MEPAEVFAEAAVELEALEEADEMRLFPPYRVLLIEYAFRSEVGLLYPDYDSPETWRIAAVEPVTKTEEEMLEVRASRWLSSYGGNTLRRWAARRGSGGVWVAFCETNGWRDWFFGAVADRIPKFNPASANPHGINRLGSAAASIASGYAQTARSPVVATGPHGSTLTAQNCRAFVELATTRPTV